MQAEQRAVLKAARRTGPAPATEGASGPLAQPSARPIARFLGRRLLAALPTLVVATFLIFFAVDVLPGDVASVVMGRNATPERLAALRADMNQDDAIPVRYAKLVGGLLTGDLGNSSAALAQGQTLPVWEVIRIPLRNSLALAIVTIVLFAPLCLLLGTLAAFREGRRTDHAISLSALTLGAMPEFVVGTLLVALFFLQFDLLPPASMIQPGETPFTHPRNLVLPVLTLLAACLAYGVRMIRASAVEVLREDYVTTARLHGLPRRRIASRYVLRNALGPSLQVLAQTAMFLVGGIIVTETVFAYPGIGSELVRAVSVRDAQLIMVISTILATIYILINILADVMVVLLTPRLRTTV